MKFGSCVVPCILWWREGPAKQSVVRGARGTRLEWVLILLQPEAGGFQSKLATRNLSTSAEANLHAASRSRDHRRDLYLSRDSSVKDALASGAKVALSGTLSPSPTLRHHTGCIRKILPPRPVYRRNQYARSVHLHVAL